MWFLILLNIHFFLSLVFSLISLLHPTTREVILENFDAEPYTVLFFFMFWEVAVLIVVLDNAWKWIKEIF